MRINTNNTALDTFNSYTSANNKIADSVAKLSSGYAINSAADNAAGLAISEKMRAQIRGLDTASENSQSAISLVQTAEGALESADEILQRMREIAVQSASDTNEDEIDREALQAEFAQLQAELDEIAADTTYNNQNLLDGSLSTTRLDKSITTTASGMSVSVGNAKVGTYTFGVSVVETAAAVAGKAPDAPVVSSSTVNSYFSGINTAPSATKINSSAHSPLLNGNYKITEATVGDDGAITVTAQGDNGQVFTATLSKAEYEGATTGPDSYALNFGDDAFTITFTKAAGIGTGLETNDSKIADLANAFVDTEFTISGGVAAKAAEKAVYATLTGAEKVKLEAGMSSVTFDNGVTVSFDKLTAANLDTNAAFTQATSGNGTSTVTAASDTAVATTAAIDLSSVITAGQIAKGAGTVYNVTIGGQTYSYTQKSTDTDATAIATGLAAAINANPLTVANTGSESATTPELTLTATAGDGTITLADSAAGHTGAGDYDFDDLTWSAESGSNTYNFENVFGTAVANVSTSTINVTSKENNGLTIQVGANTGDELEINIDRADSEYLGVKGLSVSTQESASKAIDKVNDAINQVSSQRAYLGAIENRLDYKISNLETSSQNLTSAESSIRDVDMADEMTKFTNANILAQAATAMLAQANSLPQNVLSLLG